MSETESSNTQTKLDTQSKLIYDTIVERYKAEWERTYQIESKATNIVGFVGIIFGLVSISGTYLINQTKEGNVLVVSIVLYSFTLVLLIVTIIFGLKTLYVRTRTVVPNPRDVQNDYIENVENMDGIIEKLQDSFVNATEKNYKINSNNADFLIYSFISFALGIFMALLFIFSILF